MLPPRQLVICSLRLLSLLELSSSETRCLLSRLQILEYTQNPHGPPNAHELSDLTEI